MSAAVYSRLSRSSLLETLGQDSVQAIDQGNLPVIIGFVLATAVFVVVANIVVDIAYTLLGPRVRLS